MTVPAVPGQEAGGGAAPGDADVPRTRGRDGRRAAAGATGGGSRYVATNPIDLRGASRDDSHASGTRRRAGPKGMTEDSFPGNKQWLRRGAAAAGANLGSLSFARSAALTRESTAETGGQGPQAAQQSARRDPGPTTGAGEGGKPRDGGSFGQGEAPSSSPAKGAAEDPAEGEQRRLQNLRANEIKWLHGTVQELEQRLQRRTIALVAAVVFGGVAAVTALIGTLLNGPERPAAAAEAPADTAPVAALPAGSAEIGERRVEEPEAAAVEHEAIIARLRAELEDSRAEAEVLRERLEMSRRGIEGLNAILAEVIGRSEASTARQAPLGAATTGGSSPAPGTAGQAARP